MEEEFEKFNEICTKIEQTITKSYNTQLNDNTNKLLITKKQLISAIISYLEKVKSKTENSDKEKIKQLMEFMSGQLNYLNKIISENDNDKNIVPLIQGLNLELNLLIEHLDFILHEPKKPFFARVINYLKSHKLKNGTESKIYEIITNLITRLDEIGFERKLSKQEIFILKVGISKEKNKVDISTLADGIYGRYQIKEIDKNITISQIIGLHNKNSEKSRAEMRDFDWEDSEVKPIKILEESGYALYQLLTRKHLAGEGDALKHCVGNVHNSYGRRVKSKEIEIFSFREIRTNKPILTIEYIPKTEVIEQIKKYENQTLQGNEEYFNIVLKIIGQLETKLNKKISRVKDIDVKTGHFLTINGLVTFNEYDFKDKVLSGEIKFSSDVDEKEVNKYSKVKDITLDLTDISNIIKNKLSDVQATIKDDSKSIEYEKLKSVGGDFYLFSATSAHLPLLESVGGVFNLEKATSAHLPLLESVGGNFFLNSDTSAHLPLLESVGGRFDLASATSADLPLLESVGGYIYLNSAISADLPLLKFVGGYLVLPKAETANLPLLEAVGGNFYLKSNVDRTKCSEYVMNFKLSKN